MRSYILHNNYQIFLELEHDELKPNLIFILLDGSRWDRLQQNKNFMDLVKKGTLLTNVITVIPYTFGSINAIFTGLYGKENGVDAYYKMFKLKDSVDFLPEILSDNGYYTTCNLISEKVISSRGFDHYSFHNEYEDNLIKLHPEFIKTSFKNANGHPIFCFLQFSRIHTVTVSEILKKYEWDDQNFYLNKEQNLETYDKVFDESTIYANKIYDTLDELGKLENTVVVFFSDHGTGVGERFGERNYGVYTYEETIRTSYLFIGPSILENKVFDNLLSSIDVFPTVLELCLGSIPVTSMGLSFSSIINGTDVNVCRENTFSETGGLQGPYPSPNDPNVFCVKTSNYKLIYFKTTNQWKFFDLIKDPLESQDIFSESSLDVKNLKKILLSWINR